jgi:hypothetical protein
MQQEREGYWGWKCDETCSGAATHKKVPGLKANFARGIDSWA